MEGPLYLNKTDKMVALQNLYSSGETYRNDKEKNFNKVIQIVIGVDIAVLLGWEENLLPIVWSGEGLSEDNILEFRLE